MVALVDIDQVKNSLRIDGSDGDIDLDLKIRAASEAVLDYIKVDSEDYLLSGSETEIDPEIVPERVKHATIVLVGFLLDGPDEDFQPGFLPAPVMSLLYPLRDPTIA